MKFGIDLGHGVGQDRGAVGNIAEETIINEVGTKVIANLKSLGHTVIQLRPDNASSVQDSLQQRYTKADYYNVDMCVSIHANAGGGIGTETFTYNAKEIAEARAVLNNIVSLGFTDRGIKDGSGLAMVKRPKATAMLIEICFVDSSDSDLYNSVGSEAIANAIVKGLTGQVATKYKIGWNKDSKGWYYSTNGTDYYKSCWKKIDGYFYSFNDNGYCRTGWFKDEDGRWYYLNSGEVEGAPECSMITGWMKYKGKSVYLSTHYDPDYKLYTGQCIQAAVYKIDGVDYKFDSEGYLID